MNITVLASHQSAHTGALASEGKKNLSLFSEVLTKLMPNTDKVAEGFRKTEKPSGTDGTIESDSLLQDLLAGKEGAEELQNILSQSGLSLQEIDEAVAVMAELEMLPKVTAEEIARSIHAMGSLLEKNEPDSAEQAESTFMKRGQVLQFITAVEQLLMNENRHSAFVRPEALTALGSLGVSKQQTVQQLSALKTPKLQNDEKSGSDSKLLVSRTNLLPASVSLLLAKSNIESPENGKKEAGQKTEFASSRSVAAEKAAKPSVNAFQLPVMATEEAQKSSFQQPLTGDKGTASMSEKSLEEFGRMLSRLRTDSSAGTSRLLIKLNPQHLGTVRIEIVQQDGILTTKMLASTAHGKELLDSSLQQLRQAFLQQNIPIDRLEVTQALHTPDKQGKRQQDGEHARDEKHEEKEQQTDFLDFLYELEV